MSGTRLRSKYQFQCKLNNPWAGVEAQAASKIARTYNPSHGIEGLSNSDIADGIAAICLVQRVEDVRSNFNSPGLTNGKSFSDGQVKIGLRRTAEQVAS